MSTQAEKFQEIVQAIKVKTVYNNQNASTVFEDEKYKMTANSFADQIMKIDRLKPMTLYPEGIDNGYWGNMAARTAASYLYARLVGIDIFDYVQYSNNILNVRLYDQKGNPRGSARVRDKYGRGLLDCSSYVGLVLRGVNYNKSPFSDERYDLPYDVEGKNTPTIWYPAALKGEGGLLDYYGDQGWEFPILDRQPEGQFRYFGFDGYSSIRGANQLAEFFYKYGYVVFDQRRDGHPADYVHKTYNENGELIKGTLLDALMPGDLIFFAAYEEDENGNMLYPTWNKSVNLGKNVFHSIHHIGMIAENTDRFYHVTGSDSNTENESTVLYANLAENAAKGTKLFNEITLVCRPNYRHAGDALKMDMPLNVNLLCYPWSFSVNKEFTSSYGLTVNLEGDDGSILCLSGTITSDTGNYATYLKGNPSNRDNKIHLSTGKYKLSCPMVTTIQDERNDSIYLQLKCHKDDNTLITLAQCTMSKSVEFEIFKDMNVYARLYCEQVTTAFPGNYKIIPTLIKIQ